MACPQWWAVLADVPVKWHRRAPQTRCPPSPGGGGSRAKRAGWGDLLHKQSSPHPAASLTLGVDPPPPGGVKETALLARFDSISPGTALSAKAIKLCRIVDQDLLAHGRIGHPFGQLVEL